VDSRGHAGVRGRQRLPASLFAEWGTPGGQVASFLRRAGFYPGIDARYSPGAITAAYTALEGLGVARGGRDLLPCGALAG